MIYTGLGLIIFFEPRRHEGHEGRRRKKKEGKEDKPIE
jgi:hypothetical protein